MLKKLIMLFVATYSLNALADPSPLGIRLNADTLNDVAKTYRIIDTHPSATEGYYSSGLDIRNIDIDTISDAGIISNSDKVVEGVILVLAKSKFDKMYSALSSKYKLVESRIPFVGDKFAQFEDGDCYVMINAQHLGFSTSVTYFSKKYYDKTVELMIEEGRAKDKKTNDML